MIEIGHYDYLAYNFNTFKMKMTKTNRCYIFRDKILDIVCLSPIKGSQGAYNYTLKAYNLL